MPRHGEVMPITIEAWIDYIKEPDSSEDGELEAQCRAIQAQAFFEKRGPVALSQFLAGVAGLEVKS